MTCTYPDREFYVAERERESVLTCEVVGGIPPAGLHAEDAEAWGRATARNGVGAAARTLLWGWGVGVGG